MHLVQAIKYDYKSTSTMKINASSERNNISLEINIYTKIKSPSASNIIELEITIYTKINAYSARNGLPSLPLHQYLFLLLSLVLNLSISNRNIYTLSPSLPHHSISLSLYFSLSISFFISPPLPFQLKLFVSPSLLLSLPPSLPPLSSSL